MHRDSCLLGTIQRRIQGPQQLAAVEMTLVYTNLLARLCYCSCDSYCCLIENMATEAVTYMFILPNPGKRGFVHGLQHV